MVTSGRLRVYLGAAPGVGKTFAMLSEGHRRRERGTDVLVGVVAGDLPPQTLELLNGLAAVDSAVGGRLDVEAVLSTGPKVVLVDRLAAVDDGCPRHEAVRRLLAAGVDVITTVNIDELASLRDVVTRLTGRSPECSVPDAVVRAAEQVELVDMAPEALRRRLAHGNVVPPERVDAALADYFRVGTLTALRELALLWLADRVDEALQHYRSEHAIGAIWDARERLVVALSGGPEGEALLRRGARLASRGGADLMAVHVSSPAERSAADPTALAAHRLLVEQLGGSYHQVVGDDVPAALLAFARSQNATQLVIGASRRSALRSVLGVPGVGASVVRDSGPLDVHLVGHEYVGRGRQLPRGVGGLTRRRRLQGAAVGLLLLPLLTVVLAQTRAHLNYASQMLSYLLVAVAVALVGGLWPAVATALAGSVLMNWFFTPPFHTFTIAERNNALAIAVFVVVTVAMSVVVDLAARRARTAERARAEAETLAGLAGGVLGGGPAVTDLLERVREMFGMGAASLLEHAPEGAWRTVGASGDLPPTDPAQAAVSVPAGTGLLLCLRGRPLPAEDRRLLGAVAQQVAVALVQQRLAAQAEAARPLAEADRMRTALLAAVSHDLRTPLASAVAAVSSLRSTDVDWSTEERGELLATAEESLQRLGRLVDNLLDMSRLQAGALSVFPRPVAAEDVIAAALGSTGPESDVVAVRVAADVPEVVADPALLERVVANLVANALRYGRGEPPPLVSVSAHAARVQIRVVDRGPGVSPSARGALFEPFQRLGDTDNTTGVGLGLALSRGLVEAMGGELTDEDTPGGGLTMTVTLPAADVAPVAPGSRERGTRSGSA